jgi:ligand-binding SRPBCC domain-containing protein
MRMLERKQLLPLSREELFTFFQAPENLARITPPRLGFRIITPSPVEMKVGTLIDYTIRVLGIPIRWRTLITTYEVPVRFVDEQIKGPYSFWHHTHTFVTAEGGTEMTDTVHYILPLGILGDLAYTLMVRRQLEEIFDYRATAIVRLLESRRRESLAGTPGVKP